MLSKLLLNVSVKNIQFLGFWALSLFTYFSMTIINCQVLIPYYAFYEIKTFKNELFSKFYI